MAVEAAILMDDDDAGNLLSGSGLGRRDIAVQRAPLEAERAPADDEPIVILGNDGRGGRTGGDAEEQGIGRGSAAGDPGELGHEGATVDRKSTRLNSSP